MHISTPNDSEFESIKKYISEFELDNRDLKKEQFIIAKKNNELVGFGRIRKHSACDELCSLGVIIKERKKGIAKQLIQQFIKLSNQPFYLVCIIPELFIPFGFKIVTEYPEELKNKLHYCTGELIVEEEYVVMKYLN
ncbi:MAG: GNAT family N-acetyltransferase [Bacteroidota bacterium]|nr:GNAT family N-acetyltransferase [Bacteroidota bacterium]